VVEVSVRTIMVPDLVAGLHHVICIRAFIILSALS